MSSSYPMLPGGYINRRNLKPVRLIAILRDGSLRAKSRHENYTRKSLPSSLNRTLTTVLSRFFKEVKTSALAKHRPSPFCKSAKRTSAPSIVRGRIVERTGVPNVFYGIFRIQLTSMFCHAYRLRLKAEG